MCTGLSSEPTTPVTNGRQRDQRATRGPSQRSLGHTELSGVHRIVSGAPRGPKVLRSASPEEERNRALFMSGAPSDRWQELPTKWRSNGS
jgi:hypothetical protein